MSSVLFFQIYVYGLQWVISKFGYFISNIIAVFVMVPLIHPLRITSAYEVIFRMMRENERPISACEILLSDQILSIRIYKITNTGDSTSQKRKFCCPVYADIPTDLNIYTTQRAQGLVSLNANQR